MECGQENEARVWVTYHEDLAGEFCRSGWLIYFRHVVQSETKLLFVPLSLGSSSIFDLHWGP